MSFLEINGDDVFCVLTDVLMSNGQYLHTFGPQSQVVEAVLTYLCVIHVMASLPFAVKTQLNRNIFYIK